MKLLVIDGNSIMNRAFYGIRVLTNKKGMPTNALTGFLNIFLKLMKEEAPDPHAGDSAYRRQERFNRGKHRRNAYKQCAKRDFSNPERFHPNAPPSYSPVRNGCSANSLCRTPSPRSA